MDLSNNSVLTPDALTAMSWIKAADTEKRGNYVGSELADGYLHFLALYP